MGVFYNPALGEVSRSFVSLRIAVPEEGIVRSEAACLLSFPTCPRGGNSSHSKVWTAAARVRKLPSWLVDCELAVFP